MRPRVLLRWTLAAVGVVAAVAIPLTLAWYVSREASIGVVSEGGVPDQGPVPVVTRDIDMRVEVKVTVTQSTPTTPSPPQIDGTVTAVFVAPGDVVTAGSELFSVNGLTRIAYVPSSGGVLFRDLCRGSRGPDVKTFQALLVALGYQPGQVDGAFEGATESATRQLNGHLGGESSDGCFHVDTVIPVPAGGPEIERVSIVSGAQVGTLGDWVVWRATVSDVVFEADVTHPVPDGDYLLTINGHEFPVVVSDGEMHTDGAQEFSVLSADPGSTELTGSAVAIDPVHAQVLPVGAVVVADDGGLCVGLADDAGGSPVLVSVVALPLGFQDQVAVQPVPELEGEMVMLASSDGVRVGTCR